MKTSFVVPLLLSGVALAQSPGAFSATGSMATARNGHTATLLTSGKVLIAGGTSSRGPITTTTLASAELYDPYTGTFTATGNMTTARLNHVATLLLDGKVLITGGGRLPNESLDSVEIYDPSTGTFTAHGKMTTARWHHTAVLLNTGKVLIAGGGALSAELYDPSTGTFSATGSQTGYGLTATLLNNGTVLICGIVRDEAITYELYNPATGTFEPAGRGGVGYAAVTLTSTRLTDGRVLLTGYFFEGIGGDAGLYDPFTDVITDITLTGGGLTIRGDRTATLLPNGAVLVTGKSWRHRGEEHSADLYDATTGRSSSTGDMVMARTYHTATLLADGTVLIAGGSNSTLDLLASAELYHPAVLVPSPSLLSLSGDGRGQGAIQHAGTNRIASADDPAVAGEYLSIYLTGLTDGSLITPQVAIGGRMAEVSWFGKPPGYAGLNQINVRVPDGISPGLAVPVRIQYIGRPSNEVTIGLR